MKEHYKEILTLDYEGFRDYVLSEAQRALEESDDVLKDTVISVVDEIFANLESHPTALAKIIEGTKDIFDEPLKSIQELHAHLADDIVEAIRDEELYMAQKTGTKPRGNRL